MSLVMMTESTAGQPYLIIRVGHSMLYNTKVYIFHFVCSADHIWLKHIALSPSISYCTYMPVCGVWQVHARAFFKKLFAHNKIVTLYAAALGLQRVLHLTFRGVAMIFFAKSVLTSRFSQATQATTFHIPCFYFCFLISMVRL